MWNPWWREGQMTRKDLLRCLKMKGKGPGKGELPFMRCLMCSVAHAVLPSFYGVFHVLVCVFYLMPPNACLMQDIVLFSLYARLEAAAGRLEAARKVLDTALSSLNALPASETLFSAPLAFLTYAQLEIAAAATATAGAQASSSAQDSKHDSDDLRHVPSGSKRGGSRRASGPLSNLPSAVKKRVAKILAFLGESQPFLPHPAVVGSDSQEAVMPLQQAVRVRCGYQQQVWAMRRLLAEAGRGEGECRQGWMDERWQQWSYVALVACFALFELVTAGPSAAVAVYQRAIAAVLPGETQEQWAAW